MIDMDKIKLLDVCRELIETKYNRYFSAAALVDEVCAKVHDVSLKAILNARKQAFDPFRKDRSLLRHRIIYILRKLEDQGEIAKYNKSTWMKVKAAV